MLTLIVSTASVGLHIKCGPESKRGPHYEVKGHVALDRASWFIKSVTVYYEFHMVRKMI